MTLSGPPMLSILRSVRAPLRMMMRKIRIAVWLALSSTWRVVDGSAVSTSPQWRVIPVSFNIGNWYLKKSENPTCDLKEPPRYPCYSHLKPSHPTGPTYIKGVLSLLSGPENHGLNGWHSRLRPVPPPPQKIAGDSSFSCRLDGFASSCLERIAQLVLHPTSIGIWEELPSCCCRVARAGWKGASTPASNRKEYFNSVDDDCNNCSLRWGDI